MALGWANSPWQDSYETLWHSKVTLGVGVFRVDEDLRHFVNDGLMALFFFVVGLEIKRELTHGELANRRVAALPVFAAVGGMVVPALVFIAVVGGGAGGRGWGIPMATDIAFALGVLALVGSRAPVALKLFLLTLAIVDDVGAIVVIAVFYSGALDATALLTAAAGIAASFGLRRLRVDWSPVYVVLAVVPGTPHIGPAFMPPSPASLSRSRHPRSGSRRPTPRVGGPRTCPMNRRRARSTR